MSNTARMSINPDTWTKVIVFLTVAQTALEQERKVFCYTPEEISNLISSLSNDSNYTVVKGE